MFVFCVPCFCFVGILLNRLAANSISEMIYIYSVSTSHTEPELNQSINQSNEVEWHIDEVARGMHRVHVCRQHLLSLTRVSTGLYSATATSHLLLADTHCVRCQCFSPISWNSTGPTPIRTPTATLGMRLVTFGQHYLDFCITYLIISLTVNINILRCCWQSFFFLFGWFLGFCENVIGNI